MAKKISIWSLVITDYLIIGLGAAFAVYCVYFDVSFKVMNVNVPGFIFGIMVFYFGFNYFIKLNALKKELSKSDARFSWSNFKKLKEGEVK